MTVDPQLAPLLGTWRGDGQGTFPTMADFPYEEEIRFEDIGGDVGYFQRAWDPASGMVLHAEAGIWRATGPGTLVATIAQARRTEVSEGEIHDGEIALATTGTGSATGVDPIRESRRRYRVSGDVLTYDYAMAMRDMPAAERHLAGTVRRQRVT